MSFLHTRNPLWNLWIIAKLPCQQRFVAVDDDVDQMCMPVGWLWI